MKQIPYGNHWIDTEDINEVTEVLRSSFITQGPLVAEFENAVANYCKASYAVAVSSGTAALHIACRAAGIDIGDEVITSPITFVASSNSVLYCKGKPVFADVQKDTVNINPEEVLKKITDNTKAIIPVHFAGHPVCLENLSKIAKNKNLIIIEDACHALGASYNDKKIGSCSYSDMTVFSFHPVKHITTGEGGMVLTNNKKLYEKLIMLRSHGVTKDTEKLEKNDGPWYYEQQILGYNYRISDLQCALGLSQLKKLDSFILRRREIVQRYNRELKDIEGICLPVEKEPAVSSWHLYYIRIEEVSKRLAVYEKMKEKGIFCQIHYIPVHLQPYYRDQLGYSSGDYPVAEEYYKKCISIPLYPKMSNEDVSYVVKSLKEVLAAV